MDAMILRLLRIRTFHFSLNVHNDARIVFKVYYHPFLPSPRLALSHDDRGHHLLPQVGLALLHGRHNHVARRRGREPVQASAISVHRHNVQVLRACIIGAVLHTHTHTHITSTLVSSRFSMSSSLSFTSPAASTHAHTLTHTTNVIILFSSSLIVLPYHDCSHWETQ